MQAMTWAQLFHLSESPPFTKSPIRASELPSGFFRVSKSRSHALGRSRTHLKYARNGADTNQSSQVPDSKTADSENARSPSSSFLSVLCPLLKFFGGGDPSRERNEIVEVITSSLSSVARLPWGSRSLIVSDMHSLGSIQNPSKLQLYEFEACPFCRRVREAMTELDISVEVYPCPKGSMRHREMVQKIGGKEQFPFLVDLNAGVSMYESDDIVRYLFQKYGHGRSPSFGLLESTLLTGWMPTLLRAGRGMMLWERAAAEPPSKMIELFSYENNPNARIVREALCELELPYILHNVGEGSANIELLLKASGSKQVPYLVDPNTGAQLGDYKKILSYLFQTYSSGS